MTDRMDGKKCCGLRGLFCSGGNSFVPKFLAVTLLVFAAISVWQWQENCYILEREKTKLRQDAINQTYWGIQNQLNEIMRFVKNYEGDVNALIDGHEKLLWPQKLDDKAMKNMKVQDVINHVTAMVKSSNYTGEAKMDLMKIHESLAGIRVRYMASDASMINFAYHPFFSQKIKDGVLMFEQSVIEFCQNAMLDKAQNKDALAELDKSRDDIMREVQIYVEDEFAPRAVLKKIKRERASI